MGYIAGNEVTDEGVSQRVKALLAVLAYAVDYNAKKYDKAKEFEMPRTELRRLKKSIEDNPAKEEMGKVFQKKLLEDIENQIRAAESGVQVIFAESQKNEKRQGYALKALKEAGFTDWKDRSFRVVTCGKNSEYVIENPEKKTPGQPYWISDKQKVGELFIKEFQNALPEGVPPEAFTIEMFDTKTESLKQGNVLLVSFSQAYETDVKEAFVKLTQKHVREMLENGHEVYEDLAKQGKIKPAMDFDDAMYLMSYLPYQFETEPSITSNGRLTVEILRAKDPMDRLSELPLQEQMPLLNIDRYAEKDPELKSFLEDSFGGSIGSSEDGYRRAMQMCLSHYLEETRSKMNVDRLVSTIDREMASVGSQQSPSMNV